MPPNEVAGMSGNNVASDLENSDEHSGDEVETLREDRNKLQKTVQDLMVLGAGTRSNKGIKKKINLAMKKLIYKIVQEFLWRTTKFLTSDAQASRFADKVWDELDTDSLGIADKKAEWMHVYRTTAASGVNNQRTYVGQRLRDAVLPWIHRHGMQCPTFEQIKACALRNNTAACFGEDGKDFEEIFTWYLDTLLARACGNRYDWSLHKRCFEPPSTCAFKESKTKLRITVGTEAFLVLAFDNYEKVWANQARFQVEHPGEDLPRPRKKNGVYPDDMKPFVPKYSSPDTGSTFLGGWKQDGKQLYDSLMKEIKVARALPESRALEEEYLPKLRKLNNIKANTLAELLQKKRKSDSLSFSNENEIDFEEEE